MDRKIVVFEAAREGNIEVLERVLQQNPSILDDIKLTSQTSLLHVAAKSGQLNFVRELLKRDVDIAGDLDEEGFRALDIAVIMGKVAIVKEILTFDRELARLTDKDNKSALHYAAAKGRVEIIGELLSACPDCLDCVTVHGETALHLAVKNYQFDAFAELVKWVERLSKESMINAKDGDGNTVLHFAVSTKQHACLQLVLDEKSFVRGTIEVNALNVKGLTALDISDIFLMQDSISSHDAKIRGTLQQAGGVRGDEYPTANTTTINHKITNNSSKNPLNHFQILMSRESPSEVRNAMLVVVALFVTITFQAAISPPSGFFAPSLTLHSAESIHRRGDLTKYIIDFMFLFGNTLGFSASIVMLCYLTEGFLLDKELGISLFTMSFTYVAAMGLTTRSSVTGKGKLGTMAFCVGFVAFVWPFSARYLPFFLKRAYRRKRPASNASVA